MADTHDFGGFSASGDPDKYSKSILHAGKPAHVPRRLIIVRHGRTVNNRLGRIQGLADIPLDQKGLWQAGKTAATLRNLFVGKSTGEESRRQIVVSSDLSRARQTAQAFADPLHLTIHLDPRLEERYFGEWEGMTLSEIKRKASKDYVSWLAHEGGEMRHGFEPAERTSGRGVAAIEQWAARCDPDTDLFVFSHGSIMSYTIQRLLGVGEKSGWLALPGMGNAHWAVLTPTFVSRDRFLWTLSTYNAGPPEAYDTRLWEGE